MKRFEYSAQDIFGDSPQTKMIETLNVFGGNGWELVLSLPISRTYCMSTQCGLRLLFKRLIGANSQ